MEPLPDSTASESVTVTWLGADGRIAHAAGEDDTYCAWPAADPARRTAGNAHRRKRRTSRRFMEASLGHGPSSGGGTGPRPRWRVRRLPRRGRGPEAAGACRVAPAGPGPGMPGPM